MNRSTISLLSYLFVIFHTLFTHVIAHELQPSSLEVRQLTTDRYEVVWRAPIYYKKPHPAKLHFPKHWESVSEPTIKQLPDSIIHRHVVSIPNGEIDGNIIHFIGLESTITDVFARFIWLDGSQTTAIARPSQAWIEIQAQRSSWQVAQDYTILGFEHILEGFDHLTFVLALLLIVRSMKLLLITVTSFTIAHSMTLAAATLGIVWIAGPPVEAAIALSILFLASELVKINLGHKSLTAQYPWIVAFVFGLLHGFGFAGALSDVGLPQNEVPLALLMFNVGVELGQIFFIFIILIFIYLLRKINIRWPRWMYQLPAYSIGCIASFWLIERLSGF